MGTDVVLAGDEDSGLGAVVPDGALSGRPKGQGTTSGDGPDSNGGGMACHKEKKRPPRVRRRIRPPKLEDKPDCLTAVVLARNIAEIQARAGQSKRQELAHQLEWARLEDQKQALMKVVEELAEAGEFDIAMFRSILLRELEDAGVVDLSLAEGEESDDRE